MCFNIFSNQCLIALVCLLPAISSSFAVVNKPNGICTRHSHIQPFVQKDSQQICGHRFLSWSTACSSSFQTLKTSPKTLQLVQMYKCNGHSVISNLNAFRTLFSRLVTLWKIRLRKGCTVENLNKELMYFPPEPHNCFLDVHVWSCLKKGWQNSLLNLTLDFKRPKETCN